MMMAWQLYTRYPIVARALGLAAARAKESCIQAWQLKNRYFAFQGQCYMDISENGSILL